MFRLVALAGATKRKMCMKRIAFVCLATLCVVSSWGQALLSLDSCRSMALANNKQLLVSNKEIEKAEYTNKAAKTNYLPKLKATATYFRNSREVHLLNKDIRSGLNNMGSAVASPLEQAIGIVEKNHPELADALSQFGNGVIGEISDIGKKINKGFETDTRNLFAGALTITQPIYMGGKIRAYDKITDYARQIAEEKHRSAGQEVVLNVDEAYWRVVSLVNKKKLAESYVSLLQHLDSDMQKMIGEGVATRANGLTVSVKLNEAEMALTKVDDGLTLSRMVLCQLCGMPLNSQFTLEDEQKEQLPEVKNDASFDINQAYVNRPELRCLELATQVYDKKVQIARAEFLPQIALTGNYLLTNPSVYNGFENKFRGMFNVGVMVSAPLFEWGENKYKIRAAKAEAAIAKYELEEAKEKIELQVNQQSFQVKEAEKTLQRARKNCERADENMKTANVGFKAGMIPTSDLLAAQTAWVSAHSEVIDAEINARLTQVYLKKSLGTLE